MRQTPRILCCTALALCTWAATAAHARPAGARDWETCLAGYVRVTDRAEVEIPDNSPHGVLMGPLHADVPGTLADVVLAVSVSHPYTGDLTWSLHYDADRDGRPDAASPIEIDLARSNPCSGTEAWACPLELEGTYFFRDAGWKMAGEAASLEVFSGLPAGGDWYLSIADAGPGNVGIVSEWSIYATATDGNVERVQASIDRCDATCQ